MLLAIAKMLPNCEDLKFVSANEILNYDQKGYPTVELFMEDGSRIIFENSALSSECAARGIYRYNEHDVYCIDIDMLQNYHKINEDIVGYKYRGKMLNEVDVYEIDGKKVLRLRFAV